MKAFVSADDFTLYEGSMLDMLEVIEPNSIDAIVTDPPYELNFMSKGWDNAGISFQKDTWAKCLEVLKPGGYLVAFGGTRTYHRIACAIEDAGFEIRDCIMWLYGSGFPKSMSISKGIEARKKYGKANTVAKRQIEQDGDGKEYTVIQTNNGAMGEKKEFARKEYTPTDEAAKEWGGWGTCLKPAYEPIIIARKPFKGSLIDNVLENGVGGLNIDECRVGNEERSFLSGKGSNGSCFGTYNTENNHEITVTGRFPANVTHDGSEEACAGMPEGCSRYFYSPKATKRDRDEGLDGFEEKKGIRVNAPRANEEIKTKPRKNIHPTVKPTSLMQYLIRLVAPKGSTILDPFMGSGSTGKAAMYENKDRNAGYKFIGIELTEEYLPIAEARIRYVLEK